MNIINCSSLLLVALLSRQVFAAGQIRIDGSSTVFPISEAVAEEFRSTDSTIQVTVGTSGTGGGFKRFANGEIDINNASRKIKDTEADAANKNGVSYVALPVALDGITVVVNHGNTWASDITVEELKKIWAPNSQVKTWKDIRASWPNQPLRLYGPGTDSGTFDFFTEAINGKAQVSRSDYTKSEDDNMLVQGVSGDKYALGYFGYAYYKENKAKLKSLAVKDKSVAVSPTEETIQSGKYSPLSRTIYIYVSKASAKRSEVQKFIRFYMNEVHRLVGEVGYVPLKAATYTQAQKDFESVTK